MDDMPLPDLYLVDSRKLMREVNRIKCLVLAIPVKCDTHSATQTVVDALWRLERDMDEILKVEATIRRRWTERADDLAEASQPPRVGLKVIS